MIEKEGGFTFPPRCRLKSRKDYLRARSCGKVIRSTNFTILLLAKESGPTRLGITASRKVGGAVQRNRIKRIVREYFRLNHHKLPSHTDISIIARPGASDLSLCQVQAELALLTRYSGHSIK